MMSRKKIQSIVSRFRSQIIFLQNLTSTETEPENWQEKLRAYSEITAISETNFNQLENFNFGHIITEGYFLFKIRFMKDLTIKMRILFNKRQFEIKRIINVNEQNKLIYIIALEIY